jgi:hypothetical protein
MTETQIANQERVRPSEWPEELAFPDISHLITETEEPVDNLISEKQMRLLTEPLYSSWEGLKDENGEARPFAAFANVGLFMSLHGNPIVPDMMLSLDIRVPPAFPPEKAYRTYLVWEYGKVPDVVVEIVSNRKGGEDSRKMREYARLGILNYIVYDPERWLSNDVLRLYELRGRQYDLRPDLKLPEVGLSLQLWNGDFEGNYFTWLRWCDSEGALIPTGAERAAQAEERAADAEYRATEAEERADRLAAKLRELGINPE